MNRIAVFLVIVFSMLSGQTEHTFLTYNLLNYENDDSREDDYITVIGYVQPDMIIAEEVTGQTGFDHFLSDVLEVVNPGQWSGATFTNQSASQDIALFFKHEHFSFISTAEVNTAQSSGTRNVVEWVMQHNNSGVEFRVYGVHFKASSGNAEAQERLAEATILRNYLNELFSGSHFIVAGDFNIYSSSPSSEPAFDMLTGDSDDNDGRLFDPIDRIGNWHNNASFADVHTQSPRGGSYGGMDDRFDWIFASEAILAETYEMNYVSDTYWAIGNDGNHFNQAINEGNNTTVSDVVADALYNASDHIPVKAVFSFPGGSTSQFKIVITEVMVNPAVVSDSYGEWFEIYNNDTTIIDLNGWKIADSENDLHEIQSDVMEIIINPGEYLVLGRNGDSNVNGGYSADYEYSGFQLSNSSDEIFLIDADGMIADALEYSSSFPFSSGASMYLPDPNSDNTIEENWYMSGLQYGDGDYGTPGRAWDDTLSVIDDITILPERLSLQTYPNPFNPVVTISFDVPNTVETRSPVSLQVFNINGQLVETLVNGVIPAGKHEIIWNASGQPSGVYFISMVYGTSTRNHRIILLK